MKKHSSIDLIAILGVLGLGLAMFSGVVVLIASYVQEKSPDASLGATNQIPDIRALFETSLATRITSTATSFNLVSGTDKDGNTLASSTYAFIIDEGTSNEEFVMADCTGTACTNAQRGLSVLTGTTSVTSLKHEHGRGASVKITDAPIMLIHNRLLQGIDSFPNLLTYGSTAGCNSLSPAGTLCDISYIRALTGQGSATSTETLGGIVELGTALEAASSTYISVDRPTVMQTKNATSSPKYSCDSSGVVGALCAVIADNAGKIAHSFLNLTDAFSFSGGITSTATTTLACSSLTGNACVINGLATQWPSSNGNSGYVLTNNGAGTLTWAAAAGIQVLGATTTPAFTSQVSSTTLATFSLGSGILNGTTQYIEVDVVPLHRGGGGSCHWDVQIGTGSASSTMGYIRLGLGIGTFYTKIFATSTSAEFGLSSGYRDITSPGVSSVTLAEAFSAYGNVSLSGATYIAVRARTDISATCGVQAISVKKTSI